MLGYVGGPRLGALTYDVAHTYALPVALIWLAHLGLDRLLGYGLKYPTGFKDTHLQRV